MIEHHSNKRQRIHLELQVVGSAWEKVRSAWEKVRKNHLNGTLFHNCRQPGYKSASTTAYHLNTTLRHMIGLTNPHKNNSEEVLVSVSVDRQKPTNKYHSHPKKNNSPTAHRRLPPNTNNQHYTDRYKLHRNKHKEHLLQDNHNMDRYNPTQSSSDMSKFPHKPEPKLSRKKRKRKK